MNSVMKIKAWLFPKADSVDLKAAKAAIEEKQNRLEEWADEELRKEFEALEAKLSKLSNKIRRNDEKVKGKDIADG